MKLIPPSHSLPGPQRGVFGTLLRIGTPVALYSFDNTATSQTLIDHTGRGRDGSYTASGVTYDLATGMGRISKKCVEFDGSAGEAEVANHADLISLADFTIIIRTMIVAWPLTNALPYLFGVFQSGGNFSWGLQLRGPDASNGDEFMFYISTTGSNTLTVIPFSKSDITVGAWHTMAFTRSGTAFSSYLDGVAQTGGTISGTSFAATAPLWIGVGNQQLAARRVNARMDCMAIYREEIGATDIAQVHREFEDGTPRLARYRRGFQLLGRSL